MAKRKPNSDEIVEEAVESVANITEEEEKVLDEVLDKHPPVIAVMETPYLTEEHGKIAFGTSANTMSGSDECCDTALKNLDKVYKLVENIMARLDVIEANSPKLLEPAFAEIKSWEPPQDMSYTEHISGTRRK
jgi:hypothetical protein